MEIRKANISDALVISEVLVSSWRHAYKGIMPNSVLESLSVKARAEGWEKRLSDNHEAYVIEDHDRTLGIAEFGSIRDSIDDFEDAAEIYLIYFRPESIGRGYGKRLFNHCIEQLKKQNIDKVVIWVLEKNTSAIAFYETFSFSDSGISKVHPATGLTERLYSFLTCRNRNDLRIRLSV